MIAIIDYGMGNLRSVQKAFEKVGHKAVITQDAAVIAKAGRIVLPGVGAMAPAMEKLSQLKLIDVIRRDIADGKPFLGICLGLQLLFDESDEGGKTKGLGIISGRVRRFTQMKVPHMGWNQLNIKNPGSFLWQGIPEGTNVYFCHSYYVAPTEGAVIAATTDYGINFTSAVAKDNVFAVQFHPEKSQEVGLSLIKNFARGPVKG